MRKREIMEEEQDATVKRLTPHSPSEIRGNAEKFGKEKL